jgi:Protein of unknown function (DUF3539)
MGWVIALKYSDEQRMQFQTTDYRISLASDWVHDARIRPPNSRFRGSVFDYNPGTAIASRTLCHSSMSAETYLNHPTFGLLHRLCQLDPRRELYTTLYAQRLFFLVEHQVEGLKIESLGRNDAKGPNRRLHDTT